MRALPSLLTFGAALLCLTALPASAQCKDEGLLFFPVPGSVIPTNSRFLLEGVGPDAKRVAGLVGKEIVFKSKSDAVAVKVKSGWKSEVGRYAVQLLPSRPLRPDSSYALVLEPHLPGFKLINDRGGSAPRWETGPGADSVKPGWEVRPASKGGESKVEKGRLSRLMKLHVALQDQSPGYLVVTLKRARGDSITQTYPVPIVGSEGIIGQDGCSGGFSLEAGRAYKASFSAFDVAGNQAPPLPVLELNAPVAPPK